MNIKQSIVMLGGTGAVGGECVKTLLTQSNIDKLTLLGRRTIDDITDHRVHQNIIDVTQPESYENLISGHDIAICTLGVGEPSKVDKDFFLKIDKIAVLDFAKSCKRNGVKHFQLLSSVGIDADSRSFYLRSKGELVNELKVLNFERLSIFKPSMIITPKNRYGFSQAVLLKLWPVIDKVFFGKSKMYKGINVNTLGKAIAMNSNTNHTGYEELYWSDFQSLSQKLLR